MSSKRPRNRPIKEQKRPTDTGIPYYPRSCGQRPSPRLPESCACPQKLPHLSRRFLQTRASDDENYDDENAMCSVERTWMSLYHLVWRSPRGTRNLTKKVVKKFPPFLTGFCFGKMTGFSQNKIQSFCTLRLLIRLLSLPTLLLSLCCLPLPRSLALSSPLPLSLA